MMNNEEKLAAVTKKGIMICQVGKILMEYINSNPELAGITEDEFKLSLGIVDVLLENEKEVAPEEVIFRAELLTRYFTCKELTALESREITDALNSACENVALTCSNHEEAKNKVNKLTAKYLVDQVNFIFLNKVNPMIKNINKGVK
ncbi:MAG: hypothetical protein ACRC92_27045 [Peptostreptococcaceae bacterium]